MIEPTLPHQTDVVSYCGPQRQDNNPPVLSFALGFTRSGSAPPRFYLCLGLDLSFDLHSSAEESPVGRSGTGDSSGVPLNLTKIIAPQPVSVRYTLFGVC